MRVKRCRQSTEPKSRSRQYLTLPHTSNWSAVAYTTFYTALDFRPIIPGMGGMRNGSRNAYNLIRIIAPQPLGIHMDPSLSVSQYSDFFTATLCLTIIIFSHSNLAQKYMCFPRRCVKNVSKFRKRKPTFS
jgi:hypothetical protein